MVRSCQKDWKKEKEQARKSERKKDVIFKKMSLGGGVPLVGPQEELHGPSEYAPRGFTSIPERESK